MAKTIDQMLEELLKVEGGYVNNPNDRGGETNFGITRETARANGYFGPMAALPKDIAKSIYQRTYWDRPGFAQVAKISPRIAQELFDTGVNMGPPVAAKFLQRALTALNRMGGDYPDLVPDGQIGPATLAALNRYMLVRAGNGEQVLLHALDALQGARYIELAETNPKQETFLYGWLANRLGNA